MDVGGAGSERAYPLSFSRPGRSRAEVERHTYSKLPVTYCLDQTTQSKAKLSWRSGIQPITAPTTLGLLGEYSIPTELIYRSDHYIYTKLCRNLVSGTLKMTDDTR